MSTRKKLIILLSLTLTLTSCSSIKKTSSSTDKEKISIIIEKPNENYIWRKGLLTLNVKIINNSNSKITIVKPSSDPNFRPGKYYASIENEFEGTSCISDVSFYDEDPPKHYASISDFITIEANSEKSFDFSNEHLNYCGENSQNSDTACVKIKMYGNKTKYDANSDFILNNYAGYSIEEKNKIIELYNTLHTVDIESNIICVKVK
ncbi:hypothetical protein ACXIHB_03115 [Tenacibaculum sp. IMCC1]|uniref:Lipoprotein n=1 Tax=Tenacibaculum sp. Pbs-1 TaxID=3238748 RepID=A0AB33L2B8_9FLAO|nr:hypothetical protein BACT7_26210 [Tenacibaculum mesophilum]BFF41181.1 hypothetical protein BACY1_29860 [Tenacibaculum mesophilum]